MEANAGSGGVMRGSESDELLWQALVKDSGQHARWMIAWLIFFCVLTTLLVLFFSITTDEHTRDALLIGFIGSGLGIIGIVIHAVTGPPVESPLDPSSLNIFHMPIERFISEHGEGYPGWDEEHRAEAKALLLARATQEREARRTVNRLLSIVVVTGLSLALWLAFGEPLLAAVNEVAGLVITQVQHYTMPGAAMKSAGPFEDEGAATPG